VTHKPQQGQGSESSPVICSVNDIETACQQFREGSINWDEFAQDIMKALGVSPAYYEEFTKMKEIEALWDT